MRQHVPLKASIENPENDFEYLTGGNRFAAWSTGGNMLLRTIFPDAFPLLVAMKFCSFRDFDIGSNVTKQK